MRCKDCQDESCRKEFTKVIATIAYDKCVYGGNTGLLDFWSWCKADRAAVYAEIACRNRFLDLKSSYPLMESK